MEANIAERGFWLYAASTIPKAPPCLYHYTTRSGLLSILKSQRLWATSVRFLSDASEFRYSIDVVAAAVDQVKKTSNDSLEHELLDNTLRVRESPAFPLQLFVFSLSEEGDLLSQWRSYTQPSDSYAIGFNPTVLNAALGSHRVLLAPCIYEPAHQVQHSVALLELALADHRSAAASGMAVGDLTLQSVLTVAKAMLQAASVIKHPAFSEEKEWRLVRIGPIENVQFRAGKSLITPYTEFPVHSGFNQGLIGEVIIGPAPHHDLDALSLAQLLNESGAGKATIKYSLAPFRTW